MPLPAASPSVTLLVVTNLLWLAVAIALGLRVLRLRALRRETLRRGPYPIRTVPLEALDPVFTPGPYGAELETEVAHVGHGTVAAPGATEDAEQWILSVLARDARLLFEFGTCTGRTAYLWARNSPPDARVVTLTLHPEQAARSAREAGDDPVDVRNAIAESRFERFLYSGTAVEPKVEQLFGDSKALDVSPWAGRCDLVFVDGSHAHSYVLSDSRKALALVRPGGVVLWHDYARPRQVPGVYRALNELARELPLVHLRGTTLVAYRRPA